MTDRSFYLEGWLRSLGLEQYEAAFRDNAIDETVLPDLTDQDLEKLGVLLGHRRKLLRAIANLGTIEKSPLPAAVAVLAAPLQVDTAERRQVTVMFSDLVGSTALSGRMDPEDLREIISAYQNCVADTVHRFDGFVARYMGDGVLVYFGYPRAHEDDVERAVRAGLELITAVTVLKSRASLRTRVGIATGLVVVGDLIGSGDPQLTKMPYIILGGRLKWGASPYPWSLHDFENAGAQHDWRDTEPRGAPAGDRRAEQSRHLRQYAQTPWQSF